METHLKNIWDGRTHLK